ncbi:hypothetical protein RRG08_033526 [Elysia crispata]|uniref:Uncharacterized protein n=1 Tax=Elysia crispata TaxID=231223 RepID=A0AAE0XPD3_9GAST|nr:hypothetical protein RRG08_033526 [Elysia crispata]
MTGVENEPENNKRKSNGKNKSGIVASETLLISKVCGKKGVKGMIHARKNLPAPTGISQACYIMQVRLSPSAWQSWHPEGQAWSVGSSGLGGVKRDQRRDTWQSLKGGDNDQIGEAELFEDRRDTPGNRDPGASTVSVIPLNSALTRHSQFSQPINTSSPRCSNPLRVSSVTRLTRMWGVPHAMPTAPTG